MATITLKTGDNQTVQVIDGTERDVRPAGHGVADESWFIGRCPDGRWVALSDHASQDPEYFDTEAEAEQYWLDAAEAERETRD